MQEHAGPLTVSDRVFSDTTRRKIRFASLVMRRGAEVIFELLEMDCRRTGATTGVRRLVSTSSAARVDRAVAGFDLLVRWTVRSSFRGGCGGITESPSRFPGAIDILEHVIRMG